VRVIENGEGKREGDGSASVVSSKTQSFAALRGERRVHFDARAEQEDLAFEGAEFERLSDLVDGRWWIKRVAALRLGGVATGVARSMCAVWIGGVELLVEMCKLHDQTGLVGLRPGDR
jgi:hypothetical protein